MQKEVLVQIQCVRRMGVCTGAGAHVGRRNATVLRRPDVYVTECVNGIDPLHEGEGEVLQGGLWNTRFVRNACSSSSRFLGVVPCSFSNVAVFGVVKAVRMPFLGSWGERYFFHPNSSFGWKIRRCQKSVVYCLRPLAACAASEWRRVVVVIVDLSERRRLPGQPVCVRFQLEAGPVRARSIASNSCRGRLG